MFNYSEAVAPAVRNHLDAQMAYINDMSKSVFGTFQNVVNLNLQLSHTLLEESTLAGRELLGSNGQLNMLGITAAHAQPAAEKLRVYQQQLNQLAAEAQAELARVSEEHVPETTRTARALTEAVTRVGAEKLEEARLVTSGMAEIKAPEVAAVDVVVPPVAVSKVGD
jgi:phasin family protein